jgi:hypothetical protein
VHEGHGDEELVGLAQAGKVLRPRVQLPGQSQGLNRGATPGGQGLRGMLPWRG